MLTRLIDFIFPPRADERVLRETSPDDFLAYARPRLANVTRPGTVVLLPFDTPVVRAAIHEAKYHGSTHAFTLLASVLTEYLRDADDLPKTRFDLGSPAGESGLRSNLVLIPVPLGSKRRKERGYNQTEEVVRCVLRTLKKEGVCSFILEPNLLVRTRETSSQVSLRREKREENMRGAFRATRRAAPSHTYLLVDDVLTTGATLQAAADALKEAGATHVIPLALAH